MSILRKITVRIIPIAFLAFIVVAVIAYQRGVFDLSFVERNPGTTANQPDTLPPDTGDTTPPTSDTLPPDTGESNPPAVEPSELERFLTSLSTTADLTAGGYTVTDAAWGDSYMLSKLTLGSLPTAYSLRTRVENVPERVANADDSGYTTVMKEVEAARPAVEVYMDYILIDSGSSVDVYSREGKLLLSALDTEKYAPAYTRDKADRALFVAEEPSQYNPKNTLTKYYYIDENGALTESDYNDKADSRGLYMNYPTYFGKSDNANALVGYDEKTNLYGFSNANGWTRTGFRYMRTFSFSDGLGCYVDENGFMHWFDQNLVTKVSELPRYRYNGYHIWSSSNRRLYHVYLMPDTFGEESRGMFYFDSGLVLVRRQTIDAGHHDLSYNSSWDIVTDTEVLMRSDDTEFPLPADYKLVSYSNGMILLEKDGMRGFMDSTGRWAVQPLYSYAEPFCEGLAVVGDGNSVGLIDTNGNFVIPMIFDSIENVSGGIIAAYREADGWMIFNKMAIAG